MLFIVATCNQKICRMCGVGIPAKCGVVNIESNYFFYASIVNVQKS